MEEIRRKGRPLIVVLLLAPVAGCSLSGSAGRGIAAGAVDGITARESTLVAMERRLADSAAAYVGREIREDVFIPARTTWDSMGLRARAEVDSMSARAATRIRDDLQAAVREALSGSFDLIETRTARLGRQAPASAAEGVSGPMARAFGAVGDTLAHHFVASLATGLEERLRPSLHAVMQEMTDSLQARVGEVDRSVSDSSTLNTLEALLLGVGVTVLAAIGLLGWLSWRRQRQALESVLEAIDREGNPELHRTVADCAGRAGVGEWVAGRLYSRRDCCPPDGQPEHDPRD